MKTFTIDGKTYNKLPDPLKTAGGEISPMNEKLFVQLGGTIEDDGQLTPQQVVCVEFAALIADLSTKTDKITPAEFIGVARDGISSTLISFARARGVPEDVIAEGRSRIVEVMADALRFGVTWADLIAFVTPPEA